MCVKKNSAANDFQANYLGICRNAEYVKLGVELKEHNMSSLYRSPILHPTHLP